VRALGRLDKPDRQAALLTLSPEPVGLPLDDEP
jgi:hypothetical protein